MKNVFLAVKVANDVKLFNDLLQNVSLSLPSELELNMLSGKNARKPCTLSVIFPSKEHASRFVSYFNTLKRSKPIIVDQVSSILISRNHTMLKR